MKERNLFWDNYKGILIFLVVFGHFLYSYSSYHIGSLVNDIVVFIYTFHMAAFIFVSGYFSKKDSSSKSLIKLLLYYFVFNTAMMLFLYFLKGKDISLLNPYNSYWYILSLVFWRFCIKKISIVKGIVPISIIIALLIGYWNELENILTIRRTIAFFPFFLVGYKISKDRVENFLNKRNYKHVILGIVFGILFGSLLMLFIRNNVITEEIFLLRYYENSTDFMWRILLFIIASIVICVLLLIIPNKKIPLLTKIGKNSLLIYLFHRFITILFVYVFPVNNYSLKYILYAFIASILTVIVCGGDKINNYISSLFDKISHEIVNGKDKKSDIIKTGIFIILIILLLVKPFEIIFKN